MDSRSNQILRKGYLLPGVEHVLGETGLDVARLFLARLLARLRHPLAYLLLPPPPPPITGEQMNKEGFLKNGVLAEICEYY
jgi:hypothetical protein